MASASRQQVLQSTRQWLEPLVHVLLVCGITWREFADLSKTSYVDVATKQFGKRGRPTNVSRTAVMTGLPRREVRRQREKLQASPGPQPGYVTKACLVLASWHLDPEFLDKRGKPALLNIAGAGRSFESLVARCGGSDVRPSTLLKELTSAGAVSRRRDGKIQALMRDYIPHPMDEHLVRLWGSVIADVARTYAHNMTRPAKAAARFERAAVNDRVAATAVPAFLQLLNKEGQAFLERMDQWLTAHQVSDAAQPERESVRLGIGLYQVQD
jgi:Family of unknown function (DUF6502)